MTQSLPPDGEPAPAPPPAPCSHVKGILFGRKACGVMTTLRCRRCHSAICNEHAFFDEDEPPQAWCPTCDAQWRRRDDDSGFSYRETNWNSSGSAAPVVAAGAAGAAAGSALADDDRAGLTPPASWHGEAPPADGDGTAAGDEGFDAS